MKEPPQVKEFTQQYKKDVDDIGSFIETSNEDNSYLTLKEAWERYKNSDEYVKSMQMKTFKALMIKKLGVQCMERAKIDGVSVKAHFRGHKLMVKDDDE